MVTLACGLKKRGHEIEFFIYFPSHSFFQEIVVQHEIPVHEFKKGLGFSIGLLARLTSLIRAADYDLVVSFLPNPNMYAELSCAFAPRTKLVVSERGSHLGDKSRIGSLIRRHLHRLATHVVVNSVSHCMWMKRFAPGIRDRITTIYNGLELKNFSVKPDAPQPDHALRLIAVGRVTPGKNVWNLIEALQLFYSIHGWVPYLSWVGRREDETLEGRAYCQSIDELLDSRPFVRSRWHWVGESSNISQLLSHHHALIHPSFHEGLPNAICEALATGLPVLASNVCDNGLLIGNSERGFLFDPYSPAQIAASITQLTTLSKTDWFRMSDAARAFAETDLSIDKFLTGYENLFIQVTSSSGIRSDKAVPRIAHTE